MKILFFTHYSGLYGANKSLLNLFECLEKYNLEAVVVLPETGDLSKILDKLGVTFIIKPFFWWSAIKQELPKNGLRKITSGLKLRLVRKNRVNYNLRQINSLAKDLENYNFDYVYSNSSVFDFGYEYSKANNLRHIWHLRETQEHYNFEWTVKKSKVNKSLNKSAIVLAISNYINLNYRVNNGVNNIKTLYDSVINENDLKCLDQRRKIKFNRDHSETVFGIIGIIHQNKGQLEAIHAFSKIQSLYPKTRLIIVGAGDSKPLKDLVLNLGVNNKVDILGHLDDPYEAFLQMDVSLMCSRMEGLGRVTLESMASAVPIIAYKEGGTVELIEEGINGLFYENGISDLVEKMIYMIKNETIRKRMGIKAREIFEKKYTSDIYARKFLGILNEY